MRMTTNANSAPEKEGKSLAAAHEFKAEDETVKVECETNGEVPASSEIAEASFRGRLNISDYTFKPEKAIKNELSASPRRSPRLSTPTDSGPASPSLKRVSSKRASSSPSKRSRKPSGYAPPSVYAHLSPLVDVLAPNLICLFIGLNPGVQTATTGHAYAHPSNLFWKLLHSSGCTTRRCSPTEDRDLPRLFELGNTNIVSRPTKNGSELSKKEMDDSVAILEEKIWRWRPEAVCLVGKSIWESVWRARHGRVMKKEEFKYGWQDDVENMGKTTNDSELKFGEGVNASKDWKGTKVFVATSTSGLAASLSLAEKERIWRELGAWVERRRKERTSIALKEESQG